MNSGMQQYEWPLGQPAQQPAQQSAQQFNVGTTDSGEITLARSQMLESISHLSSSLRNAAAQCDNFAKIVARSHPVAAASAFHGIGADFLALANGTSTIGAAALGQALPAAVPAVSPGHPGRKSMSKEEKSAKKKERKLNRDPNEPKRPPSAYLLFQNEVREDMRARHPDLVYADVLGKVSEAWKSLSDEQRKVYQDKTIESMAQWNANKKAYSEGTFNGITDYSNAGAAPAEEEDDDDDAGAAAAVAAAVSMGFPDQSRQDADTTQQGVDPTRKRSSKDKGEKKEKKRKA
ncbi:hypothetical protein FA09DRAFT_319841 [Tilletiopsis washingtonensis]|uniref:HMG box domain-containing protein n=1 Tax=Tilletiopsis washingtonensis TaxID=58919 RepID=A0A316Z6R2_9BASI|nr:hypothetical protein FA09DRAFT_319841 [Tilletiopsis washingtonensis]PWN97460.1 hypothetical protein FA09DRAFT_319841 [Tilletiopsis washingtonensis]